MGLLASPDGRNVSLRASHVVGRAAAADLCVPRPDVSANHAAFRWTGDRWHVRDLGSRNGTFVNGRRVEPGTSAPLAAGDRVAFGDPAAPWTLVDAAPPSTHAISSAGETRVAEGGILALPSNDRPLAQVYAAGEGRWTVEMDGATRPVEDGEAVDVGGRTWRLFLASPVERTAEAEAGPLRLGTSLLRFVVSLDEEHVELEVVDGARRVRLPPRACLFVLLALARARLADRARGELPEGEHGWTYHDDLCRMLRTDESRLRVDLFRARRHLLDAGLVDGAGIVERRPLSGQLRLATGNVDVVRAS